MSNLLGSLQRCLLCLGLSEKFWSANKTMLMRLDGLMSLDGYKPCRRAAQMSSRGTQGPCRLGREQREQHKLVSATGPALK